MGLGGVAGCVGRAGWLGATGGCASGKPLGAAVGRVGRAGGWASGGCPNGGPPGVGGEADPGMPSDPGGALMDLLMTGAAGTGGLAGPGGAAGGVAITGTALIDLLMTGTGGGLEGPGGGHAGPAGTAGVPEPVGLGRH